MSDLLSWAITLLVIVLLAAFVLYLVALQSLPLHERPRTRTYDRFGQFVEMAENPDYHENPGEGEDGEDDESARQDADAPAQGRG